MQLRLHKEVIIPVKKTILDGDLVIPVKAKSIVIFSHGSGSSRMNTRNRMIAHYLQQQNIGTLLFDLLTEEEDMHYYNRFDIDILTKRLIAATEWLEMEAAAADCRFGYFGAGTGAAAALKAGAFLSQIGAIVSRGGRPDLAIDIMEDMEIPVLLIAGSLDKEILNFNKEAFNSLTGEKKLEVIEGASHFFEEPGKMEKVCELATAWFLNHLQPLTKG